MYAFGVRPICPAMGYLIFLCTPGVATTLPNVPNKSIPMSMLSYITLYFLVISLLLTYYIMFEIFVSIVQLPYILITLSATRWRMFPCVCLE